MTKSDLQADSACVNSCDRVNDPLRPGMSQPTRRALLGGAGLAASAIVTGGMALATNAKGETLASVPAVQVSSALVALIAEWQREDAKLDHFYATVFNPAVDRERVGYDAIPHVTIEPDRRWMGHPRFWSTDHTSGVAMARNLVANEPRTSKRSDVICARKLVAALHRRERAIKANARVSGMDAADAQEAVHCVVRDRIRKAIHTFPVAGLADFRAKLAWIESDDGIDGDELLPLVIADARRLAGEVRA